MSAFICSNSHINALAALAGLAPIKVYRPGLPMVDCFMNEQFTAELLLTENARSVNARYHGDRNDPTIEHRHEARFLKLTAVEVIKLCNCYDYQACESKDYPQTLACALVDQLRKHYITELPGYDDAAWELDDAPAGTHQVIRKSRPS